MKTSFHLGDSRVVIAIPLLGVVVKLPRIRFHQLGRLIHSEFKGKRFRTGLRRTVASFFKYNVDTLWAPKRLLFKGFADNWREWQFSQEFGHPVIARTHLWLGVLNIQAYAHPFAFKVEDTGKGVMAFAHRFTPIIGSRIMRDAHHFQNVHNFGVINGHFAVVDYADDRVQSVLRECASDLVRDFPLT